MIRDPQHVLGIEPWVEEPNHGGENHHTHDGNDKVNHLFVANGYASRARLSGIRASGADYIAEYPESRISKTSVTHYSKWMTPRAIRAAQRVAESLQL
jgi:hypothetical protein